MGFKIIFLPKNSANKTPRAAAPRGMIALAGRVNQQHGSSSSGNVQLPMSRQ